MGANAHPIAFENRHTSIDRSAIEATASEALPRGLDSTESQSTMLHGRWKEGLDSRERVSYCSSSRCTFGCRLVSCFGGFLLSYPQDSVHLECRAKVRIAGAGG